MSIYWFDLVSGVLLLIFAGFGWKRGLVKEFFFTAAWGGGYLAALFFYKRAAILLKDYVTFAPLADFLAFLMLFAGVYLLVRLLEYVVGEKLGFKLPRAADAPGGALMGLIKGFIILALFLLAIAYWPPASQALLANSYILRWTRYLAHPAGPLGLDMRPPGELKNDFNELKGKIPDLKDLKGSIPSVPAVPELPEDKLPPAAPPVAAPSKAPVAEPRPASPKTAAEKASPAAPPVAAPQKAPAAEPRPVSPKTAMQQPAVSPPQPASPKRAPAPPKAENKAPHVQAEAPRVKQVEPVKKNLPETAEAPPEDENRKMDKFIKSLD